MSDESMERQPSKTPHTVDSTNSSVTGEAVTPTALNSPVTRSTILSENNRVLLTETIRSYINALKFDTSTENQEEAAVKKGSSLVVAELLGRSKNPSGSNKKGKGGGTSTKSKVTFSSAVPKNQSSALIDRLNASVTSQQQQHQHDSKESVKRDKSKSSTSTVIREWGKRPMLVESEAPWTPRNRMYQNTMKAVERARQLNPNGVIANNNGLPTSPLFQQQQLTNNNMAVTLPQSSTPQAMMRYAPSNSRSRNLAMVLPVTTSNVPKAFPYGAMTNPMVSQQQPVLTGITPFPVPVDINNRPLAVAIDPPTNQYVYQQHPEMVFPAPAQHQTVIYQQLDSQGVWVPVMEQPQLYQYQQQQQQQQP